MSRLGALVAPVALAAVAVVGGACAAAHGANGERVITLTIRHSRFSATTLHVDAGTFVRFVVRNTDPIDHELIVGDEAVQVIHEHGTETHHGARPGEVSVPAGTTASTTYVFSAPGPLLFGCHLPGHWSYGMHGSIVVVP